MSNNKFAPTGDSSFETSAYLKYIYGSEDTHDLKLFQIPLRMSNLQIYLIHFH